MYEYTYTVYNSLEFSEFSFAFPKAHTGKNGMQSSINIGE